MCCCYYTVTCRCLLWLVVSLVAILFIMAGVLTPKWLVGQPVSGPGADEDYIFFKSLAAPNLTTHVPSIGIHHRCMTLESRDENCSPISIYGFGLSSDIYPVPWKAAMVFLVSGAIIQFAAVIVGVSSCCSIFVYTVSVFSLTGAIQAFAGVCSVIGMVLYPWGWGSQRVKKLCGDDAEPYMLGDCSLGWSLYVAATGVALIFVSSALSKAADKAANSDRVQYKIDEGKQLICIA